MDEITIVRRRSRLAPILLTLLLVALLILAALWMMGLLPGVAPARFDVLRIIDAAAGASASLS